MGITFQKYANTPAKALHTTLLDTPCHSMIL